MPLPDRMRWNDRAKALVEQVEFGFRFEEKLMTFAWDFLEGGPELLILWRWTALAFCIVNFGSSVYALMTLVSLEFCLVYSCYEMWSSIASGA